VDVDGAAAAALSLLPQLDHGGGGVAVRVCVVIVAVVRLVDGYVQVGQVELYGGLRVAHGHADTLDALPHHRTLGLFQQHGAVCMRGAISG